MTFGVPQKCPTCKKGSLKYKSHLGYKCTGLVTEWAKCEYVTTDPKRTKFKVPSAYKEEYPFL